MNKNRVKIEIALLLAKTNFSKDDMEDWYEHNYVKHTTVREEIYDKFGELSDDGFYELTKEGGGELDWNEVYDYDWCYHTHYPIDDKFLFCPTYYEVQTFLRDKHKKQITVTSISQESWQYRITEPNQRLIDGKFGEDFETYEKALIDAIKVTLKEIIND